MPTDGHLLLLVEDDPDQREALATLLEVHGYAVIPVAGAHEALSVLATGLQPCVIVLDLMMPDMDAHAFMKRHHQEGRTDVAATPVILYSAGVDLATQAHKTGVSAHVQKPDIDRLLQFIERLC
jgi:CheY-like chemotaxis protein